MQAMPTSPSLLGGDATRPGRAAGKAVWVRRLLARSELWVAGLLALFVVAMTVATSLSRDCAAAHQHLGAEYGNIGRAIADGRGFSDPFGVVTGPTAWMPPVLPLLLAGLFAVLKTRWLVAVVLLAMDDVALVAMGMLLYALARRHSRRLPAWIAVVLYLGWIAAFNYYFVILTHDVCLVAGTLSLLAWATARELDSRPLPGWGWGLGCGATALVSPTAALSWAVVGVALALRDRARVRRWLGAVSVAAVVVAPWTIRNAFVLHAFIPTKSNAYCDLYFANYVDDDGLWDVSSMARHPFASAEERFKYARLGESAYAVLYKRMFTTAIAVDPQRYARNVARRLLAATVKYASTDVAAEPPIELAAKRILVPLVFGGLIVGALRRRGRNAEYAKLLAVAWGTYVTPYVLIGFYARHLLPVTFVAILAAFLGYDAHWDATRRWFGIAGCRAKSTLGP